MRDRLTFQNLKIIILLGILQLLLFDTSIRIPGIRIRGLNTNISKPSYFPNRKILSLFSLGALITRGRCWLAWHRCIGRAEICPTSPHTPPYVQYSPHTCMVCEHVNDVLTMVNDALTLPSPLRTPPPALLPPQLTCSCDQHGKEEV